MVAVIHRSNHGPFKSSPPEPLYLKPDEKVASIKPDHHVRRQGGKLLAYVCEDKRSEVLILSQKLNLICDHINQLVPDKPDQVSMTGLFQILSVDGNDPRSRTAGWSKHRWKIHKFSLEDVTEAFETLRKRGFQNAVVLGSRDIVQTQLA